MERRYRIIHTGTCLYGVIGLGMGKLMLSDHLDYTRVDMGSEGEMIEQ
jgi:hypothetical protein